MLNLKRQNKVFIVAEISANHGQDFNRAAAMIKKAGECGADAVKFQAYTPETMTINSDRPYFRIRHPEWGGQTLYQLYEKAHTPWRWFKRLKKIADDMGIIFFSTAFDRSAVDFLEALGVPLHKIASFELVDIPLIEYAARTKKPLVLSTGMATLPEIKEAVYTAKKAGADDITLLKCVSDYPASPGQMNLVTIPDLKIKTGCRVGFSDHTLGIGASVAAAALGASMIEKHFTLSRSFKTPDSFFSIEPMELKLLVENIRIAEDAAGRVSYGAAATERKNKIFRRSLFVTKDVGKGEAFTQDNVRSIRPGHGLPPKFLKRILGKKAKRRISRGTPLRRDLIRR